jgi:hypothetical protein
MDQQKKKKIETVNLTKKYLLKSFISVSNPGDEEQRPSNLKFHYAPLLMG